MLEQSSLNQVWTLDKLKTYLISRAKFLLLFAGIGLLIGLLVLLMTPKRYEASFLVKMPTANAINEFGILQPHLIKVVPPAFDAKKEEAVEILKAKLTANIDKARAKAAAAAQGANR